MSSDTDQPEPAPKELEIHPDYNDEDSDLVLVSSDRRGFCVHKLIMKLASAVFKTMMVVATQQDSSSQKEFIDVQEDSGTPKVLLDIVYPNMLSFGSSAMNIAQLREVCLVAEKYEIHGVLRAARVYLRSMIGNCPPLVAFSLASRYEWEDELRLISTATLSIDLYSPESMKQLQHVPASGVFKLMQLHRRRRDLLVSSLDLGDGWKNLKLHGIQWSSIKKDSVSCSRPWVHFETPRWTVLKYRLSEEMERKADGSSIRQQSFWDRSEFNKIWTITCPSCYGQSTVPLVDKCKLKCEVIRVLDGLSNTIESDS